MEGRKEGNNEKENEWKKVTRKEKGTKKENK
jgi:hypothetical protein